MNTIQVKKEDGRQELFSFQKFSQSLLRAGASQQTIDRIGKELEERLYPGISTREIYRFTSGLLKKIEKPVAGKFNLKKAILALGPSGFPFEKLIARLFEQEGYSTEVGLILNGICVKHEVDVLGKKENRLVLVECKFHNHPGIYVDVKVPLYINSRFQDLLDNGLLDKTHTEFTGWIATNNKFSDDATTFATCKGIQLLGWNFPVGNSLANQIEKHRLYPLTCLTSISGGEKKELLDKGLILVKELQENLSSALKFRINDARLTHIEREINSLMAI